MLLDTLSNANINEELSLSDDEQDEMETLKQKTAEIIEKSEQVKGKNIVPIFGLTGVGKSLLINLLCNCKLITVKNEMDLDVLDCENPKTKVGQTLESETSIPICVESEDCNCVLLDCPGFFDSRGELTKLLVNYSIRLSIQQAEQVKGIIIMIDIDDLISRSSKFNEIASLFGTLLKENFPEKSMLVVINNKKNHQFTRTTVSKSISEQLVGSKSRFLRLAKQTASFLKLCGYSESEKESASLRFLNMLNSNLNRIHLLDVKDQRSIIEIKRVIKELTPVSTEYFETNIFDETWSRYNTAIRNVVEESMKFYDNYANIKRMIDQQENNIASLQTRIESYSNREKELKRINIEKESELVDSGLVQLIKQKNEELQKLNKELQVFNQSTEKVQLSKKELEEKQKEFDSEELQEIFSKQICEKRISLLGWMFYTAKTIEYNAQCPYIEKNSINKGKLTELKKHSSNYYHKYYSTGWGEDADMEISLWAKKKDLPHNKVMSESNLKELQSTEMVLKARKEKTSQMENFIEAIKKTILGIEAGKSSIEETKKSMIIEGENIRKSIDQFELNIKESQTELKRLEELLQIEEANISNVEEKTNGIENAFQLLGINQTFVNFYMESKQRFTQYKKGKVNPTPSTGENQLDSLFCPISYQLMVDPIVLPCCNHTIDRDSLYRIFASKSTCPLCRGNFDLSKVMKNKSIAGLVEEYRKQNSDQLPDSYLQCKSKEEILKMENDLENRIKELKQCLEREEKKIERIKEVKSQLQ